ncbi:MAG TPA: contractile injection system protein, VgrG/Pvc8 family [Nitrosomonas sp.]|nr:contractile injection system protein, VgrG/Pvc8 family [Nitrosomonas sp.]
MINRRDFDTLTPEIKVRINAQDLPVAAKADVVAVNVTEEVNASGTFAVTLSCWDGVMMEVKWIDDELFEEGNVVEIQMGYRDHLKVLFNGEITGLEPEFSNDEPPILTVLGYDRCHRIMRKRRTESYLNMKDSDIASQIAGNNGLKSDISDTKITMTYVLQHNQTDLEFLRQRANRIGYEVGVSDQILYFRPRQNNGTEVLTLSREVELLEFYPRLSTVGQLETVSVKGWDPKKKETVSADSQVGDAASLVNAPVSGPAMVRKAFPGNTGGVSTHLTIASQAEAEQLANGWFKEMSLQYVVADGVCIGLPELRAGTLINIEGLGRRFSGRYYVTGTEHSYKPSRGYRTAFTVRRDAT